MKYFKMIILFSGLSSASVSGLEFETVTMGPHVEDTGNWQGSAWGDYDNDGDLDLFVANYGGENRLYRNNGQGFFEAEDAGSLVSQPGDFHACAWADMDNDGHLDLFVSSRDDAPDAVWLNNGDGTFRKVAESIFANNFSDSSGGSWGDFDKDGHIDLFVNNLWNLPDFLFRNDGNLSFQRVTDGALAADRSGSVGSAWADYDNDGNLDLFIANGGGANSLYKNNGDGTFSKVEEAPFVSDTASSVSAAWGDYDNDGDLDLFVANRGQNNFLYNNQGDGSFLKIVEGEIVNDGGSSNAAAWGDLDGDGDLDLFVANWSGESNRIYINDGDGTFTPLAEGEIISEQEDSASVALGDYDRDEKLDIFVTNEGRNSIFRNISDDSNWLTVRLEGNVSNKSSIGARLSLAAGGNVDSFTLTRQIRDCYEISVALCVI